MRDSFTHTSSGFSFSLLLSSMAICSLRSSPLRSRSSCQSHTHCDVSNLRHTTSESSPQHLGLVYNPTIKVETANPQSRSPVNRKLINPCITGKSLQFCLILTALTYLTESAGSLLLLCFQTLVRAVATRQPKIKLKLLWQITLDMDRI